MNLKYASTYFVTKILLIGGGLDGHFMQVGTCSMTRNSKKQIVSGIVLGFLSLAPQLCHWMVTSFWKLTRKTRAKVRARVLPWYKGERREKGKTSLWQCTQSSPKLLNILYLMTQHFSFIIKSILVLDLIRKIGRGVTFIYKSKILRHVWALFFLS